MNKLSKILFPSFIGLSTYFLINKFFPKSKIDEMDEIDRSFLGTLLYQLSQDPALKIGLLALFGTATVMHFNQEIVELLSQADFLRLCKNPKNKNLPTIYLSRNREDKTFQIICDIAQKYDLFEHLDHSADLRELILNNKLTYHDKVNLLKIKLDFIINGEYFGKTRFVVVTLLGLIMAVSVSGVGGLALILEALYRLFQEGKISKAVYWAMKTLLLRKYRKLFKN